MKLFLSYHIVVNYECSDVFLLGMFKTKEEAINRCKEDAKGTTSFEEQGNDWRFVEVKTGCNLDIDLTSYELENVCSLFKSKLTFNEKYK